MDLRRLEALSAVVDEGSFEKAARRLCCAQSTVTFQIRQLEQELGLQLFEKVGRRMRLTEAGQGLMPQVRELARMLESLRAAARREEPRGRLRVAVGESLLAYK
ncbi:LysR family transcriptional regulator, partial [Muribaculaceae bacterium Isolate-002 (NCI)]